MVLGIVDGVSAVDIMCASLPKSRCTKRTCYMYSAISMTCYMYVHTMAVVQLTSTPTLLLADIYMFGLFSGWLTNTGSCICRELSISASTCGGADAVRAMNGAFDKARNSPSLEKDSRKPLPLGQISSSAHIHVRSTCTHIEGCVRIPTNHIYSVPRQ